MSEFAEGMEVSVWPRRNDALRRLRALEEEQATLEAAYAACDDRDRESLEAALDNVMDAIEEEAAELDAIDENWSADYYVR